MSHINNIGPVNWSIEWYTTDRVKCKTDKEANKKVSRFSFFK